MNENSLKYAAYWRNALADTVLGNGALTEHETKSLARVSHESLIKGCVPENVVAACFEKKEKSAEKVQVDVRPFVFRLKKTHGVQNFSGLPEILTPIHTLGELDKAGELKLLPEKTFISRDLLEPIDPQGRFPAFTLGDLDDLDEFLNTAAVPGATNADSDDEENITWETYISFCRHLLEKVCTKEGWKDLYEQQKYVNISSTSDKTGIIANVLGLYDSLKKTKPQTPLFDCYSDSPDKNRTSEPLLPFNAHFSERSAHANPNNPLTSAQRQALTHLLDTDHGEILAVNGPPGTGKTTLLLSAVATLWANAALKKAAPPVIIAASTNNQAVTNIIEAFGKDFGIGEAPFQGRWLPEVTSYGSYLVSPNKPEKTSKAYQTQAFFRAVETEEYLEKAQTTYLNCARAAFRKNSIETPLCAVELLHIELEKERSKLVALEDAWNNLSKTAQVIENIYGRSPLVKVMHLEEAETLCRLESEKATDLFREWERYIAQESLVMILLGWIPAVRKKRRYHILSRLRPYCPDDLDLEAIAAFRGFEHCLREYLATKNKLARAASDHHEKAKRALENLKTHISAWNAAASVLNDSRVILSTEKAAFDHRTLLDVFAHADTLADTTVRFKIFRLATHYWEGRWLAALEERRKELAGFNKTLLDDQESKGATAVKPRWYRRMMLTPCSVATFFRLPAEMEIKLGKEYHYAKEYLYDFADLLIVDEAGQVLPEVAGASFSLAKKALVIGDVHQIEPIWSTGPAIDIANLVRVGLLSASPAGKEKYGDLQSAGKTASGGSVMLVAQNASRWHAVPELERGLFLLEHWRCYDDIVAYCNTLTYKNVLQPKRGARQDDKKCKLPSEIPSLGYIHIDGLCKQSPGGSRTNIIEAHILAQWLSSNKSKLEQHYDADLSQIVGAVTPFGAQAVAIRQALLEARLNKDKRGELTVGTVHSLQGAERPIVLFSPVYTKASDGFFIDRSGSMLNVAVSRVKDAFIVIGDMDIFHTASSGSPRRVLADALFSNPDNAIPFSCDLSKLKSALPPGLTLLAGVREHDDFLRELLERGADETVVITSPWITMSALRLSGLFEHLKIAQSRGVEVSIVGDKAKIIRNNNDYEKLKCTLNGLGVRLGNAPETHAKIVWSDENLCCVGSFNWLSAKRTGDQVQFDATIVYRGDQASTLIADLKKNFRNWINAQNPD